MGFGRRDEVSESGISTASSSSGSSGGSGFGNLTAFIDQGSEFEGKLSFKDTVRIDGRFSGEISSENTLIVGESGEIEANIHSPAVVISGTVVGDVHASRQLVMHKTARLTGDVSTPNLVMEEGASLNGMVKMPQATGTAKASDKDASQQKASGAQATPSSGPAQTGASGGSNPNARK